MTLCGALALGGVSSPVWSLATATSISAQRVARGFAITAIVTLPTPCNDLRIIESTGTHRRYLVQQRYRGGVCAQVIVTRTVTARFISASPPARVDVLARDKHWNLSLH